MDDCWKYEQLMGDFGSKIYASISFFCFYQYSNSTFLAFASAAMEIHHANLPGSVHGALNARLQHIAGGTQIIGMHESPSSMLSRMAVVRL